MALVPNYSLVSSVESRRKFVHDLSLGWRLNAESRHTPRFLNSDKVGN